MQPEFKTYAAQVIENAQAMATAFVEKGYKVISGGTDNHLMLIDLRSKGSTGKAAEEALGKADITVKKNMVPFDTEKPMITSGIRIGTAAVTSRGLNAADCTRVAGWIDSIIMHSHDDEHIGAVRAEINQFMLQFPLYPGVE